MSESKTKILHEFQPPFPKSTKDFKKSLDYFSKEFWNYVHIPYLPAFHHPGWLLRYILGPYDKNYFESAYCDIWAGITVALTLIPQALSYGKLANQSPVNGLFAAILPSAAYTFFGSAMQLAVGPVAVVSLLTGQLVTTHCGNAPKSTVPPTAAFVTYTQCAQDTGTQAALTAGLLLVVLSLLNLGNLIRFISKPVISGFTTGAALTIGLSQVKDAFGFIKTTVGGATTNPLMTGVTGATYPPQQGQTGFDFNYQIMQWFVTNWDGYFVSSQKNIGTANLGLKNPYAIVIAWSTLIVLEFFYLLKLFLPASAERKKTWWYTIFSSIVNILPLVAIIVGANVTWQITNNQAWVNSPEDLAYSSTANGNLQIVGSVPSGLDFIKMPNLPYEFGTFLGEVIPIALILYMESYSVGRRIATKRNELQIMNASQEMWSNGIANILASISTAFPVSGSFSRSSLNYTAGARTPLSKITTLIVVLIVLSTLTDTLYYIPKASLAAIIMVALTNLIAFDDIWESFINSKKDFMLLMVTLTITFVFETSYGLAVGLGLSFLFYIYDIVASEFYKPSLLVFPASNNGIAIFKITSDVNFVTGPNIKDAVTAMTTRELRTDSNSSCNENLFKKITNTLDTALLSSVNKSPYIKDPLPLAIIVDLELTKMTDISGLTVLKEIGVESREKNVKVVYINVQQHLVTAFIKFGLINDVSTRNVDLDSYLKLSALPLNLRFNKLPDNPYGGVSLDTHYKYDEQVAQGVNPILSKGSNRSVPSDEA